MNILLITGSPHRSGTSSMLADRFALGARDGGHSVRRFDAAFMNIKPCLGCDSCRRAEGCGCVHKDDMQEIADALVSADMVAFVTPLYYFGMSAQLKAVIDRFYSVNALLRSTPKKAVLLATCADTDEWAMDSLKLLYSTMLRYLKWEDRGHILASGMSVRADMENSRYPQTAYEFGRSV